MHIILVQQECGLLAAVAVMQELYGKRFFLKGLCRWWMYGRKEIGFCLTKNFNFNADFIKREYLIESGTNVLHDTHYNAVSIHRIHRPCLNDFMMDFSGSFLMGGFLPKITLCY